MKTHLALALLFGAANLATAADLIVTESEAKGGYYGGQAVSLDMTTDGAISAANFRLQFKEPVASIDTKSCLRDLPKTHQGLCEANPKNGRVSVVLWSTVNEPLPQGIVGLGQIVVQYQGGVESKRGQGIVVDRAFVSDASGQASPLRSSDGASRDLGRAGSVER